MLNYLNVLRWPFSGQLLLFTAVSLHLALYLSRVESNNALPGILAWFLAIVLFLAAFGQFDREQGEVRPLKLDWRRIDLFAVALLMLLAFVLRVLNLEHAPLTMHNDEAIVGVRALNLVGKPLAPLWVPDEMSLTNVWYYLQAFFILLVGRTAAGVRMFAVVAGTFTILTAYLMIRLLFPRRVTLGAVFLLATYHFHIHFSRLGLSPVVDPLFGTLIFSSLVIGVRTNRRFFFALAGVIMGVAINFYTGSRLFIPLVLLMGAAWYGSRRANWQQWLQPAYWFPIVVVTAGLLVAAAPQIQNAVMTPKYFFIRVTVPTVAQSTITEVAQKQGWTPEQFWLAQFGHAALSFYLYPESGYQGFYDKERPLMHGLAAWLMGIGSLLAIWQWRQQRYQLLIAWYLLMVLVGGALMQDPSAQQRYVTLSVVACLLVAIAIDHLWTWLVRLWPRGELFSYTLILTLFFYLALMSVYDYFWDYLPRAGYGTASSQYATALAYQLQTEPANTHAWFVGPLTVHLLRSHIPQYLTPQVQRHDLTTLVVDPTNSAQRPMGLPAIATDAPTLFVTAAQQTVEREQLAQWYPGGTLEPVYWFLNKTPVLFIYRLENK